MATMDVSPTVGTEQTGAAPLEDPPAGASRRLPGGGPAGRGLLVRAMRSKTTDMRKVAHLWLNRFAEDCDKAVAELVTLILVIANVPSRMVVEKEDVQNREPADVVQDIVAALALEASEKGADFTQHWLVLRERGAIRVRENYPSFWRTLASSAPCQALIGGLLQYLHGWILALADCQFRSIRHAAAVAGLNLVEGLGTQCSSLRNFCNTALIQQRDAEAQVGLSRSGGGGDDRAATRLSALTAELDHANRFSRDLAASRNSLGVSLLSRRTKDVDPEIRRSAFEAMCRWAHADTESFVDPMWTTYLHFGLNDRDSKARGSVLAAVGELLKGDPTSTSPALQKFAQQVRPRILERCHDVEPSVGAAAVRCGVALASRHLLAEEEFDPIIDLVWDSDVKRRGEAAVFVSRHVFTEDILDYAADAMPTAPGATTASGDGRRRVHMLLQFVTTYSEGHFQLVDRFVAAMWRRASCLEDWEVLAGLALPGNEHSLSGDPHTVVVHVMEAVARLASEEASCRKSDGAAYAEALLDRISRALAPRLQILLVACQAEPAAMRRASSLARFVLRHCALRRSMGTGSCGTLVSGPVGEALTQTLKAAFLRQPDPDALEHISEAFSYLLDLTTAARPIIKELADFLRGRFISLAPQLVTGAEAQEPKDDAQSPPPDVALLATATRLRMLAKAYDVSMCDLQHFVAAVLELLDDRAAATSEGRKSNVSAQHAITSLELLINILVRHTVSSLGAEQLKSCVLHDPIDEAQLRLLPTAMKDLFGLAETLLKSDPNELVKTAALATTIALLTGWWNTSIVSKMGQSGGAQQELPWALALSDGLTQTLWEHFGNVLLEANAVPPTTGGSTEIAEAGNPKSASALSQLFSLLQRGAASVSALSDIEAAASMTDSDRVRLAALAGSVVSACRHEDWVNGPLPALVLSQGLSPREDLQEVAWKFMRRLRKEGGQTIEAAEGFFVMLLRSVKAVHQDAGAAVAKDLSYSLLQHVGVGKLAPTMQAGLIIVLRAGIDFALAESTEAGLLEALLPWVTKHVVEDESLSELATWAEQRPQELGAGDAVGERAKRAGIPTFVATCRATAAKCEAAPRAASHGAPEADSPATRKGEMYAETPPAKRAAVSPYPEHQNTMPQLGV